MSEFVRFIEQRDFEDGLAIRLQIGSVAVGDVCKIRSEDIDTRLQERPLRFTEATVSVVAKREDNGFIRLDYAYDALRSEGVNPFDVGFFNEQSIAFDRSGGMNLRTYLSDQPDSRWDDSMSEIIDLESASHIR